MQKNTTSTTPFAIPKVFETELARILVVFILGALALAIHVKLRMPLGIPGRHGIVFMALLFAGKFLYDRKFSGSIFSLGCGSVLLFSNLGFSDPFMPFVILLPGIMTDFLSLVIKSKKQTFLFVVVLGAVAYISIPAIRLIIMLFTGYPYGTFAKGIAFPFFTYFVFGAVGTAIAYGVHFWIKKSTAK